MERQLINTLHRTLLLMRDELELETTDEAMVDALTGTKIVLAGDKRNLASHAAQCAYITAAVQMARSGHRVYLVAPDLPLVGRQPPLRPGQLISSLVELGRDLLPGVTFEVGAPSAPADLAISFGDSAARCPAHRSIAVNASAWTAVVSSAGKTWQETTFPLGAMAAGTLAAVESFKAAMMRLRSFARNPAEFDRSFAFARTLRFDLAPQGTLAPQRLSLGSFDCVSGGAIIHAALFALARIPRVTGTARVIEPEANDDTNLNRYALLRLSEVGQRKIDTLSRLDFAGIAVEGVPSRYEPSALPAIGDLASHVLVGVDHIPTRWMVQKAWPRWLGVGATTHWSAMASFHTRQIPCAGCLHPHDEPGDAKIPTVAFVSFWAGLLLASYFARERMGQCAVRDEQGIYLTSYRPDKPWRAPVARHPRCPVELGLC